MFQPDSMAWLQPWSSDLADTSAALAAGKECLVRLVQGLADPKGLKTATAAIASAQKLYDLLQPINRSVIAARAGLNK
jgi:hypothetical protein